MAIDKVQPLKLEDSATGGSELDQFPTELNPQEDYVECAGLVLDDAANRDETTRVFRDGDDLKFVDTHNPTPATLSELRAGGGYVATQPGQILISLDGATFTPGRPVADDNYDLVLDDNFQMVVTT